MGRLKTLLRNFRLKRKPSTGESPQKGREAATRPVIVGIDFGTSSTKSMYRDLTTRKCWTIAFDHKVPGYSPFCLPSTVRAHRGKLWFGVDASRSPSGSRVFRSFKVCLACQFGGFSCRGCYRDDHGDEKPGTFVVKGASGGDEILTAFDLVALYLGHVLGLILDRIEANLGRGKVNPIFHMAAPLSYQENRATRQAFHRALEAGRMLAGKVSNPIEVDEGKELVAAIGGEDLPIPAEEDRSTALLAETVAAITSLVRSRRAARGHYAMVDVGAGTTDVTFAWLPEPARQEICFYSALTGVVGGDDIEAAVLAAANGGKGGAGAGGVGAEDVRRNWSRAIRSLGLDDASVKDACDGRLGSIHEVVRRAFGIAYLKEPSQRCWKLLDVLLLGGGVCNPLVSEKLTDTKPRDDLIGGMRTRRLVVEEACKIDGPASAAELRESQHLLVVAHGLSHHPFDAPDYVRPEDVEPLMLRDDKWEPPNPDEIYTE